MEALQMRDQVNSWNDDRLDELNRRVDNGFKAVDKRFEKIEQESKEAFAKVDKRFEKIEERLAQTPTRTEMNEGFAEMRAAYAALNRTLLVGLMAIVAALIGVVGALVVS
jgi:tetrahydromethanopterin S-methyltransferase subunit G